MYLKLALARLRLQKTKNIELGKARQKEIGNLLQEGQFRLARVKVRLLFASSPRPLVLASCGLSPSDAAGDYTCARRPHGGGVQHHGALLPDHLRPH